MLALSAERAIAAGLLVTELATNSIKYAYPDGEGNVRISLEKGHDEFTLIVSDQGQGLPADFDLRNAGRQSLGMRMINSLSRQLGGKMVIDRSGGTTFKVVAPIYS